MKQLTIIREVKKNNFLYLLGKNSFIMFFSFLASIVPTMFIIGFLTSFQNIWNYGIWALIGLIIGLIVISYGTSGIETEQIKEKVWIEEDTKKA